MHKPIYASGFLYHLATQQILLQQSTAGHAPLSVWSMFGDFSHAGEDAQAVFRRIMREQVDIHLDAARLFPVYDYEYHTRNTMHYVLYAEVKKLFTPPECDSKAFSWFTFKQTTKLVFSDQAKQDVIVSERVINAEARSKEPPPPLRPGQRSQMFH